jgi:hypothetical protein
MVVRRSQVDRLLFEAPPELNLYLEGHLETLVSGEGTLEYGLNAKQRILAALRRVGKFETIY